MQEYLTSIPEIYIDFVQKFVDSIKKEYEIDFNNSIYLSLSDHIFGTIKRFKDGISLKNVLLLDIKQLYKKEYEIGFKMLSQLNQSFNIDLAEDEAGFIALHFVNAQEGDIAIVQTGTSMIPTIPPGSILQLRKVENWREYFGYGNIFVIELTDGRRITKEVSRYDSNPKEFIWCISHNPGVPDEELPKSMIVSVWKVIKVLTDKGW